MRNAAPLAAVTLCAFLSGGCQATRETIWATGLTGESGEITSVQKRDHYLDATLELEGETLRFFFPGSYDCTQVIKKGQKVDFLDKGLLPAVRKEYTRCDPVGVLSLEDWAKRHRREMEPRNREADVTYEVYYKDEDLALARGEFQFAHVVAMTETRGGGVGTQRTVGRRANVLAVLPNTPECQKAIAAGQAHGVYAEQGPPYTLVSEGDRCVILGMVQVYSPKEQLMGPQVTE